MNQWDSETVTDPLSLLSHCLLFPLYPLSIRILHLRNAFFVPNQQASFADDDGGAGAGGLFIGGAGIKTPSGVNLPIDTADGAFVAKASALRSVRWSCPGPASWQRPVHSVPARPLDY